MEGNSQPLEKILLTLGDVGGFGDFPHRDGVDSALAEQAQGRTENEGPCSLTGRPDFLGVEHVQIMGPSKVACQGKNEHVQSKCRCSVKPTNTATYGYFFEA